MANATSSPCLPRKTTGAGVRPGSINAYTGGSGMRAPATGISTIRARITTTARKLPRVIMPQMPIERPVRKTRIAATTSTRHNSFRL